jgi:hypothetical protein
VELVVLPTDVVMIFNIFGNKGKQPPKIQSSEVYEQVLSFLKKEMTKDCDWSFDWIEGYKKDSLLFDFWLKIFKRELEKALDVDGEDQQLHNIIEKTLTFFDKYGAVFGGHMAGQKVGAFPLEGLSNGDMFHIIGGMLFKERYPSALAQLYKDLSVTKYHAVFSYKKSKSAGALSLSTPIRSLTKAIKDSPRTYQVVTNTVSLDELQNACENCYSVKSASIEKISDAQIENITYQISENICENYGDVLLSWDWEFFARYLLVLMAVPLAYIKTHSEAKIAFKKIIHKVEFFVVPRMEFSTRRTADDDSYIAILFTDIEDEYFTRVRLFSQMYQFEPAYEELRDATFCLARFAVLNKFAKLSSMLPDKGHVHDRFFEMLTLFAKYEVSYHRDIRSILQIGGARKYKIGKEVEETCQEIESEILDNLAAPEIKSTAIKKAKDKKKTIASINEDGLTPQLLAHILITNAIQELIGSGQYHVYRGTLNAVGNALVESWDYSVDQLEKLGRYSSEEAAEDKSWLRNEIKNMG